MSLSFADCLRAAKKHVQEHVTSVALILDKGRNMMNSDNKSEIVLCSTVV